jgi:hypothetical protein
MPINESVTEKADITAPTTLMGEVLKNTLERPREKALVTGTVIGKGKLEVYVDIPPFGTGLIFGREYLNARDIIKEISIGEHDYALLYIAASADSTPLPSSFPEVVPDIREAIGFVDDAALVASYPVEFISSRIK